VGIHKVILALVVVVVIKHLLVVKLVAWAVVV
jgi:hypothetical protein